MKNLLCIAIILTGLTNCSDKQVSAKNMSHDNALIGTWKMVYAETKEKDSVQVKDLSDTKFIKIITPTHFVFFNQDKHSTDNFYAGAGTYELKGNNYVETLNFTAVEGLRNHQFPFLIQIKQDTLIQSGIEEVKVAGIKREILEKYVKINSSFQL